MTRCVRGMAERKQETGDIYRHIKDEQVCEIEERRKYV